MARGEWLMLEGGDGTHRISFLVSVPDDEDGLIYRLVAHLTPEDVPLLFGLEDEHRGADGKTCGGYVAWAGPLPSTGHSLVSLEPLTISPSLACQRCPSHGFIRDGRWHDA